jgi:hypothetical protein
MTRSFLRWLTRKWQAVSQPDLMKAYHVTFSSVAGQQVLQHLMDRTYCSVYFGTDPMESVAHNARRALVHEILENIDAGERPDKYNVTVQTEEPSNAP